MSNGDMKNLSEISEDKTETDAAVEPSQELPISHSPPKKKKVGVEGYISVVITPKNVFDCDTTSSEHNSSGGQNRKTANYILSKRLGSPSCRIVKLVDDWNEIYHSDEIDALSSILELILHTAGVAHVLSREIAQKLNLLDIHRFEHWIRRPLVYSWIKNECYLKNLKTFFSYTFVEDVLSNAQFMIRIHHLLKVIVNSKHTCARTTALNFGSLITEQYAQFLIILNQVMDCSSESSEEERDQLNIVNNYLKDFASIVIICLRDINLPIRKFAFEKLCNWMKLYPEIFVDDWYLRHVYFAVVDKTVTIRCLALKACKFIIISQQCNGKSDTFLKRVFPLLFRRTYDVNTSVGILALQSLTALYRRKPELFENMYLGGVYKLMYCNYQGLPTETALFLSQVLKTYCTNSKAFIVEILHFNYESQIELGSKCDGVLVAALFPHARFYLTDWKAWLSLFLGSNFNANKPFQELACHLLLSVMSYATGLHTIHPQNKKTFLPGPAKANYEMINQKTKLLCDKFKTEITIYFGHYIFQLWDKYRCLDGCNGKLLSIPRYFSSNIDVVDMKTLCCTLLVQNTAKSEELWENISTLAHLRHLMSLSSKWKKFTVVLYKCLFKETVNHFLVTCYWVAFLPKWNPPEEMEIFILKKCNITSKYFDVSETKLLDHCFMGLQLGMTHTNALIICNAAPMCLNIIRWQLKRILDNRYSEEELTARLYKIQSQSRTLLIQLGQLIRSENSTVARITFKVIFGLLTTFHPYESYIKKYPVLQLPNPTLELTEWLNFHLFVMASTKETPSDEFKFFAATKVLSMFCSMLETGILHLSYISSILPYFKFYDEDKNYNSILCKTVEILITQKKFAKYVADSLALFNIKRTDDDKKVATGLCLVCVKKLKPLKYVHKFSLSIISCGIINILKHEDHSLFRALSPFVKLLSKADAVDVKKEVKHIFKFYIKNDIFVQNFLSAF